MPLPSAPLPVPEARPGLGSWIKCVWWSLTLQEVQLAGRDVEADEVEAPGGSAASSLSRRLADAQTLQHAALAGSVQAEDQDLPLPAVLLLL